MGKFSGLVGYVTQKETSPGVWTPDENPVRMRGDVLRQHSSTSNNDSVNGNVSLNHRVSIMGDAYAFDNYYNIKWVEVDGQKWEVTTVEVQRPRIILNIGGVWNG